MKDEINRNIKQLQNNIDDNNKSITSLSYGKDSDNNSVDTPDSIKGEKARKRRTKMNDPQGEASQNRQTQNKKKQRKKEYDYFKEVSFNPSNITIGEQVTSPTPRKMMSKSYEVRKDAEMQQDISNIVEGIL